MPFRVPRSGALALALAIPFLASVPGPLRPRPTGPHRAAAAPERPCGGVSFVVGDSRRTLEHAVLPQTTDRVWAQMMGTTGGPRVDGMRHVRYLAAPGAIHTRFTADLAGQMARCGWRDRPLVFDFMGTNYAILRPERIADLAYYREIESTIVRFYDTAAPKARIVLAELTLDRTAGDASQQAGIAFFLDHYNGVLRDLARSRPSRYYFLPAPGVYERQVRWRDLAHETAESPMPEYASGSVTGALDAAGLAVVDAAGGNVCALVDDPRFGFEQYSEGVTLIAYLQDFRGSPAAKKWLTRTHPAGNRDLAAARSRPCTF